jgi:hypothetical protein
MNSQPIQLDANCEPIAKSGQPHMFTYDPASNLLWLFEDAHPKAVQAAEADQIVKQLRAGGFEDWRLAPPQQLITCVDYQRHEPAANTDLYAVRSAWYWTSEPASWNKSVRWCVGFSLGLVYYLHVDGTARVRAVRSWAGPSPAGQ